MTTLNARHDYGLDLFLLSVDEGITGYRDDSLEVCETDRGGTYVLGPLKKRLWFLTSTQAHALLWENWYRGYLSFGPIEKMFMFLRPQRAREGLVRQGRPLSACTTH